MPDYARACRPPDYAPNYAIMPSIMARALRIARALLYGNTQHARLRRSSVDFRASESSWIEALEGIGSSLAPS